MRSSNQMETLASDESSQEEDEAVNGEAEEEVVDANCLHCGEAHEGEEQQDDEIDDENEVEPPDAEQPLAANSPKAQTCDILDRNLYLRRIFVITELLSMI